MPTTARRKWHLPETHNIRDLGGYSARDGRLTRWNRLLRADDLWHLTEASREALVAQGLALVIDLRGPHETVPMPSPFATRTDVTYRNIAIFDRLRPVATIEVPVNMGERYCEALDTSGDKIAEVFRALLQTPQGVAVFHCTAGKDRTGLIAALALSLAGVPEAEIIADYSLTGLVAGPMIARLRSRALAAGGEAEQVERILSSAASLMALTLDHLRAHHGGAAAYLAAHGLSAVDLRQLQDQLLAPLADQDHLHPDHAHG